MGEATFRITHTDGTQEVLPTILVNAHRTSPRASDGKVLEPPSAAERAQISKLQSQLPQPGRTPLIALPKLAANIKQGHVFVKDESDRFGLPSFKILGASWAIYRALCKQSGLKAGVATPLRLLRNRLSELADAGQGLTLVACSAGNWGRACARMAAVLGVRAIILLPKETELATRDLIDGEGETVEARIIDVSYDAAVLKAAELGSKPGHLLVMDTSWEGFTEVPSWVVQGYSTMLDEVEAQVKEACGTKVTMVIVSVGVGSWAQAVVDRYRAEKDSDRVKIVTVEPSHAACLMASLHAGELTAIRTTRTIMNGMNCGVVSGIGWPSLRAGVDVAVAVHDSDVHVQTQALAELGLSVGPCGAATLVALQRLYEAQMMLPDPDGVVVCFSTEGPRSYDL